LRLLSQMITRKLLLPLFLLSSTYIYSQKISGQVRDSLSTLPHAIISIKKDTTVNAKILKYTLSNSKGYYEIATASVQPPFFVECQLLGYKKSQHIINQTGLVELNFDLQESKEILNDVYVEATTNKIIEKNDSTFYNLKEFVNGDEKNVEDILKKLPGIDVNSSGKIFFKGRAIEALLIDGDDLLSSNYTLGSKNISADIIEEVQAIEKYQKNRLLKNWEKSQDVAINLKIKEGASDLSGTAELGIGNDEEIKAGITLLKISKKHKAIGVSKYNTVGLLYDNFNIFSGSPSPYSINKSSLDIEGLNQWSFTEKQIDNDYIYDNRYNKNNINSLFRIRKNIKVRTYGDLIFDRANQQISVNNTYRIDDLTVENNQSTRLIKKPKNLTLGADATIDFNEKSLIQIELLTIDSKSESYRDGQINTSNFNNELTNKLKNIQANFLYSNEISKSVLLQLSFEHVRTSNMQSLLFGNGQPLFVNNTTFSIQDNRNTISFYKSYFKLFWKLSNKSTIISENGHTYNKSTLSTEATPLSTQLNNNLNRRGKSTYTNLEYNLTLGNLNIAPKVSVTNFNVRDRNIVNANTDSFNNLVTIPSLKILFKFNKTSYIYGSYDVGRKVNSLSYHYDNYVVVSEGVFTKNDNSIFLNKNETALFGYRLNNLFNQLNIDIGGSYIKNHFASFSNNQVTDSTIFITKSFIPSRTSNSLIQLSISKFLPFINSTIKLRNIVGRGIYFNRINASDLRLNTNKYLNQSIYIRSGFKKQINFETGFGMNNNRIETNRNKQIVSLNGSMKVIYNISNKLKLNIESKLYTPDVRISDRFFFLNFEVKTKVLKKLNLYITGRNITSTTSYISRDISDYNTRSEIINLENSYIMGTVEFSF